MEERARNLIMGYIHEFEKDYKKKTNDSLSIADPIILLLTLYFIDTVGFDLELNSKSIKLSGDNNEIAENRRVGRWCSIFGKRIFKGYGKYEWNIEIIKAGATTVDYDEPGTLVIGIQNNKFCKERLDGMAFGEGKGIGIIAGPYRGIYSGNSRNVNYGQIIGKKGDKIKMILDLDNLMLSYVINGTDYGAAVTAEKGYGFDLNKDDEYRFGLSFACVYDAPKVKLCL